MRDARLVAACLVGIAFATPAEAQDPPAAVRSLIELWTAQNSLCRGSSGDKPETQRACMERQATGRALDALNWCYGAKGQMAYQMRWHRCRADSNRYE